MRSFAKLRLNTIQIYQKFMLTNYAVFVKSQAELKIRFLSKFRFFVQNLEPFQNFAFCPNFEVFQNLDFCPNFDFFFKISNLFNPSNIFIISNFFQNFEYFHNFDYFQNFDFCHISMIEQIQKKNFLLKISIFAIFRCLNKFKKNFCSKFRFLAKLKKIGKNYFCFKISIFLFKILNSDDRNIK